MEICSLADLTLVACPRIPVHVVVNMWPPEANKNVLSRRKYSFVSQVVMSILNNRRPTVDMRDDTRGILLVLAIKLSVKYEVSGRLTEESLVLSVR